MTAPLRSVQALSALRLLVSVHLFIHGLTRATGDGYVAGFGSFLTEQGFPFGVAIATAITAYELVAPPLLALGRFQRWIALGFAAELTMGIILVHAREGWFVVGAGRNGAEYSVLLIGVFLAIAWGEPGKKLAADSMA